MNGYTTDLPTNMENSRNCLRRIARHDDQEFSNQSILNAMDKFVKSVNTMDETILVPCRLMDRKVGDATDTVPVAPKAQHYGAHHGKKSNRATTRELLNTSELFQLYNTLKLVKVDLLWGRQDAEDGQQQQQQQQHSNGSSVSSSSPAGSEKVESNSSTTASSSGSTTTKGHVRRPSTVSVASSNSASTLSDSDSETSAENDSGIESEGNQEQDRSAELAKQFRTHLLGLYRSLEQMSEAANYLTARYQSDVGPV
ncbi:uncharacterized protein LOC131285259 isoform X2 [Anopheles ziemanni]|uniref:uncharacterized protein LOC131266343 isoform X2 n=1 Tax=Anopheles coustani TaxID=139045 RepID=UPI0026592984|nr:uncharacterized protein LOC131266343 isoform X2 [Anopheles coustani]XP_058170106.1 uncharacterized protein LOC131285259 isoform X2 [Anopheles ziemanni]